MEKIKNFIENITPMNDADWQFFSSKFEEVQLKRKTVLLNVGEVENYISFIKSGITRLYIPRGENSLTVSLIFENQFVTDYDSFLTRNPSTCQIETLTDTVVWRISYSDLQEIYEKTESGNLIGRKIAETIYVVKSERERALLSKTPEELYLNLFTTRPKIIKQIPLKHIASFIGITPQALSRIRKRIS
jgi:CRP-like cAMP-binding protein